ncbi:MAG TPA: 6-phosphofructokinase [Spirochaetota bacterium]|nr:6-phosphofructokinase [Spirochaetota bacterium]HQP49187.1 6-phosphofructokinase [Spirochaetota bacterium]
MTSTLKHGKVGILFSGGPAPSANTVISSTALNFLDHNIPVIGFYRGYEFLQDFNVNNPRLRKGSHFEEISYSITRSRNERGIYLRTSRANPGKNIKTTEDLRDPEKNVRLRNILDACEYLEVGAIVSIGGDDTLKTANYLYRMGLPIIHIPKTIDNDYYGIPWTFGYWTAVDAAQKIMLNLRADAQATDSFFLVELMGRKAGWITYAAGIAAEAIMMISTEDYPGDSIDLEELAERITDVIIARENNRRPYGVIAISEGLAEKLPEGMRPTETDRHGNIVYGQAHLAQIIANRVKDIYKEKTGLEVKLTPKQIGYETRAAAPISFDVVLGSMLGYGAYKFYSNGEFGVMVSVTDNFELKAVPFTELIDPETLKTRLRGVPCGSDFYTLKERLSYRKLWNL